MTESHKECCGNCRFWVEQDLTKYKQGGFCRRVPPVADPASFPKYENAPNLCQSAWPITSQDTWCGEWQISPILDPANKAVPRTKVGGP